jgi:hypothetical protein
MFRIFSFFITPTKFLWRNGFGKKAFIPNQLGLRTEITVKIRGSNQKKRSSNQQLSLTKRQKTCSPISFG